MLAKPRRVPQRLESPGVERPTRGKLPNWLVLLLRRLALGPVGQQAAWPLPTRVGARRVRAFQVRLGWCPCVSPGWVWLCGGWLGTVRTILRGLWLPDHLKNGRIALQHGCVAGGLATRQRGDVRSHGVLWMLSMASLLWYQRWVGRLPTTPASSSALRHWRWKTEWAEPFAVPE